MPNLHLNSITKKETNKKSRGLFVGGAHAVAARIRDIPTILRFFTTQTAFTDVDGMMTNWPEIASYAIPNLYTEQCVQVAGSSEQSHPSA